ncbi:MAG: SufBD protein N-terminal region, partial [Actinomycetota bacterium]
MPVLTPDMVRSTGNSWSDVRSSALARASAAPFPTTDLEHWRYSRIDELDLARFAPTDTPSTITGGGANAVVT